ncbi:hypothetical protein DFH08DRAFT_820696 [Mycena albidolilacea]|uniref:Uncharacterized protein n=1 Tax=Mycena albidolilacea TaxID=1033008 RepID=A0AAD6ZD06_9AGAR|nr:hypothetical protein DFH08DRAFT_820696 [Mycena albidolilacea]
MTSCGDCGYGEPEDNTSEGNGHLMPSVGWCLCPDWTGSSDALGMDTELAWERQVREAVEDGRAEECTTVVDIFLWVEESEATEGMSTDQARRWWWKKDTVLFQPIDDEGNLARNGTVEDTELADDLPLAVRRPKRDTKVPVPHGGEHMWVQ